MSLPTLWRGHKKVRSVAMQKLLIIVGKNNAQKKQSDPTSLFLLAMCHNILGHHGKSLIVKLHVSDRAK